MSKVFDRKSDLAISPLAKKYLNFLSFAPYPLIKDSHSVIFGSYNLKIQPYPSDIDCKQFIDFEGDFDKCIDYSIYQFQKKVSQIINTHGWFFTDAKCGIYPDGEAVHWTADEILKGKRDAKKPDFNGHLGAMTLEQAFRQYNPHHKNLIKIDMVVPYYKGYIEVTMVYIIKINGQYVNNIDDDFSLNSNLTSLRRDALKQEKANKLLKVIKRIYSQARAINDKKTGLLLEPLLRSDVSKLGSFKSDVETLKLIFNKDIPGPVIFKRELEIIRDQIGSIYGIPVDTINQHIDRILQSFKNKHYKITVDLLDELSKLLNYYINQGVTYYLHKIGWSKFPSKYVGM